MVSVEPDITDATLPVKLSGPYSFRMSESTASAPLPDIGRRSARGSAPLGNPVFLQSPPRAKPISSIAPLARSIDTAAKSPTSGTAMFILVLSPCSAPLINKSYAFLPRISASIKIAPVKTGIAEEDIIFIVLNIMPGGSKK